MIFTPQESSILSNAIKTKPKKVRKVQTREARVALKMKRRFEFVEMFKKMGV